MDNPGSGGAAAVDFSRIKETSDGDLDFERELFTVFLEDCEERLARLRDAVGRGDVVQIHREAHTIKGAASNVGTVALQALALEIEGVGEGDVTERGPALMARLDAEFVRVRAEVDAYLSSI